MHVAKMIKSCFTTEKKTDSFPNLTPTILSYGFEVQSEREKRERD